MIRIFMITPLMCFTYVFYLKSSDLSRSHELPVSSSEERSFSLSFLAGEKQSNTLQTKEADEEKEEQIEGKSLEPLTFVGRNSVLPV